MACEPGWAMNEFLNALRRAAQHGNPIQIERLSGGSGCYTFEGRVMSVDATAGSCVVQRSEESGPRQYWIRYMFRITGPDGVMTPNAEALSMHAEVLAQREQRVVDVQRALVDQAFVPGTTHVPNRLVGRVPGTLDGEPCELYAFRATSDSTRLVIVHAVSEVEAVRCMRLLDADTSIWDVFAVYVKARFLWPPWLTLRRDARAAAERLRAGAPCLSEQPAWSVQSAREELYAQGGLTYANYSHIASLESLEIEEGDIESLFQLAERVPPTLFDRYLSVSWKSNQFFDDLEGVNTAQLKQMIDFGLARERPPPSAQEALERMAISKLRELAALAGTGFKAKGGDALRHHLQAHMTPELSREAVSRAKRSKYEMLAPPNWTWAQFQFFRQDYRNQLETLREWMCFASAPAEAAKRFSAMV